MTEKEKNTQNKTEKVEKEPEVISETYYDDEDPTASEPWETEESMQDKVADCVIGAVPYKVLEHLNNGRKEFVKAGIALAEDHLNKADEFMERAKKAHKDHQ